MKLDIDRLKSWTGHQEILEDLVTPVPVAALSATLDRDDPKPGPGAVLPPLWHWLYFLPLHKQSEIGPDGHAKRGGFLPPVPLPRRMWAGGRLTFHHPIRVGETIRRTSTIADVSFKEGRTGPLVFVLVRHEIANSAGVALVEEHDIVYRDVPQPSDPAPSSRPARSDAVWRREIHPDDVLLFRYSALTFNGHRIHYDRRYVTEVEGYPGLVVHGPLLATLMLELLRDQRPEAHLAAYEFRALRPTFDTAPFEVCGEPAVTGNDVQLWVQDTAGHLAMTAKATLR